MNVRLPAVAGRFYPGTEKALERELARRLEVRSQQTPRRVRGILVPHAGYIYSGGVAGKTYAAVDVPPTVVILCPNHTGMGAPLAIMSGGVWRTPLGDVPVEGELARALTQRCSHLTEDVEAHRLEHSLEVQLPFLQHICASFSLVPICVGTSRLEALLSLGDALAEAIRSLSRDVLLVASSDMTHYEPAQQAKKKDELALARCLALDPPGLHEVVVGNRISMCGAAPAVAVMQACRGLGGTAGELVCYANSGDVSGDYSQVVGYAGVLFP